MLKQKKILNLNIPKRYHREGGNMKRKGCIVLLLMITMILVLVGCSSNKEESKSGATTTKANVSADVTPLKEENDVPKDGIISKDQMSTIAGQKGTYYFNGKTKDGITYQWRYKGKQIQNPVEQNLLVECSSKGLDDVKKAAGNAPYALKVTLKKMNLAAPATLTLTLKEEWKADRILYCLNENGKLYQLDEGKIENKDGKSKISFVVTRAGGDFFVLGGSTASNETEEAEQTKQSESTTVTQTQQQQEETEQVQQTQQQEETKKQEVKETESKKHTCTIAIDCKTILDNWDDLNKKKEAYVPKDGWILKKQTVEFEEGETVFDILKRVLKENKIQMESSYTPMYGSYYVEGINQLYEFDCGKNSGWMYRVNGWYPNYGCSSYTLEDGDEVEWRYTCNLGSDVGDVYMGD